MPHDCYGHEIHDDDIVIGHFKVTSRFKHTPVVGQQPEWFINLEMVPIVGTASGSTPLLHTVIPHLVEVMKKKPVPTPSPTPAPPAPLPPGVQE